MDITISKEDFTEKIFAKIMDNVTNNLKGKDLTEEEVQANLVLAKRSAANDASVITNLVFEALA
jgi:hypothetical protein